ncbi:L-threonylcarbamoyladenylate synthase [Candidatus Falkowbacteria bacterium]|nr:L-threonylcarbamoyladenylate synthase [Candidatus Falkowbacteria bacterium]
MLVVKNNQAGLKKAAAVLRAGGVALWPSDTTYILAGVFDNPAAIKKILQIKQRRSERFILIAASLAQVKKFFRFSAAQEQLAKKFWPGPLSIAIGSTFAVRVPADTAARDLAAAAGSPLIATSANRSGRPPRYSFNTASREFSRQKYQPDVALNAGQLPKVLPSTVVKVARGRVTVLRQGPIVIR